MEPYPTGGERQTKRNIQVRPHNTPCKLIKRRGMGIGGFETMLDNNRLLEVGTVREKATVYIKLTVQSTNIKDLARR